MSGLVMPRWRGGERRGAKVVGGGLAAVVAASLLLTGLPSSQAATGTVNAKFSSLVPTLNPLYLTPNTVYGGDPDIQPNRIVQSAKLSAGPVLGTVNTLPVRASNWSASDARVAMTDSTGKLVLFDGGKQVTAPAVPGPITNVELSGSWLLDVYSSKETIASLTGVSLDVTAYDSAVSTSTTYTVSYVPSQLGSLFLVVVEVSKYSTCGVAPGTYLCSVSSSVTVTVRDAANGGKVVGSPIVLTPPTGMSLDDFDNCSLASGSVDCGWVHNGSGTSAMGVSSTNWLTGKTAYIPLPLPAGVASVFWFASMSDGVAVAALNMANSTEVDIAYNLSNPAQYAQVAEYIYATNTGTSVRAGLNNHVLLASITGAGTGAQVAELPFGGASAPYLIGLVGDKSTVSPSSPLSLDLDFTKNVAAGTLTVKDPSGKVVGTVATPASYDGSLRGVSWAPPVGSAGGTYTWALAVKDSAGKAAVNNVGDGPVSGSFTVAPGAFTAAPVPTVSGTATVGSKLTAAPGTWLPSGVKLSYQWLRDGVAISGATGSSYTLVAADAGASITVSVTGSLSGYVSTSKTSKAVSVSPTVRSGGVDRYDTATLVAQQGWTSAQTVYLAYGQNFPDALAGVSLATVNDAPILLTGTDKAPDSTMAQLKSLGAKNVVLLGGTVAISAKVEKQLTTAGYSVSRIAGIDRYDTAALIGAKVLAKSKSTTAVIATGDGFADALSISPVAGMDGWPVLFAKGNTLPDATSAFIKANKITTVYIVGGTGAVGTAVESALKKAGVTTITRLAGIDRYDTSAKIAAKFKSSFTTNVSVATGSMFADALTGGVLSAKFQVPMLLLNPSSGANPGEKTYAKGLTNPKVYVYGGTSALPDSIVKTLLS